MSSYPWITMVEAPGQLIIIIITIIRNLYSAIMLLGGYSGTGGDYRDDSILPRSVNE